MKRNYFWEWNPLVSFGVFKFGSSLVNYKKLRPFYLNENLFNFPLEVNIDFELSHFFVSI
jgi:hypothetical protein